MWRATTCASAPISWTAPWITLSTTTTARAGWCMLTQSRPSGSPLMSRLLSTVLAGHDALLLARPVLCQFACISTAAPNLKLLILRIPRVQTSKLMHAVILIRDLQAPETDTREGGTDFEAASPTADPTQLRNQFNYSDRAAQVRRWPLIQRRPVCLQRPRSYLKSGFSQRGCGVILLLKGLACSAVSPYYVLLLMGELQNRKGFRNSSRRRGWQRVAAVATPPVFTYSS